MRKVFGWAKSLGWLVGDDDPNAERSAYLEKRNRDLEGMTVEALRSRIGTLEGDNYGYRQRNAKLDASVKALEEKSKGFDDLQKELETYRAFGKPDEVTTKLKTLEESSLQLETYRMAELVASAAKTTRLEFQVGDKKEARPVNADKLTELVNLHKLKLELRDGTLPDADGKPVAAKIAHVLTGEKTSKPLSEYLATDLSKFADWVAEAPTKPTAGSTTVVPQSGSGNPPPATAGDSAQSKRSSETYQF
jgi:hypothetical protein